MTLLLQRYGSICRLISKLLPGQIETVLHDLSTGKIVAIEGAFSNREIGDSSLIDVENLHEDADESGVIGPYPQVNSAGEHLRSFTAILNDDNGKAIGLICLNCRTAAFAAASELLSALTQTSNEPQPKSLFAHDWREAVNQEIAKTLTGSNNTLLTANRSQKVAIIHSLDQSGLLEFRGSPEYVAKSLGVSRASFYNLLKDARKTTST